CLYYSVPFRDHVINYPSRSPTDTILYDKEGKPRPTKSLNVPVAAQPPAPPLPKLKTNTPANAIRNVGTPPIPPKPEDKESPEYKKKQAVLKGPVLSMNYDNGMAYGMSESLFTSLKDIFEAVLASQSRIGVVSPAKFLEILRRENEMFRSSMHQDAHEFLNLLLNEVVSNVETEARKIEADKPSESMMDKVLGGIVPNMSNSRTPNSTGWVHELFEGTLTSETKCLTCENVSQRDEPFLDLSVDLEQHSSVTSCLRKFSEEEMLCERNKFHCDMCGGLQEAEKRMKVKRLPKILALHLKRFKYTEDLQRLQKLFHRVVYPYHLRLFNTTDDAEDPDRLYELYAVVVHIGGGPYHGHYVAIIKTEDRGWLLFDDEMVEPVDKDYVKNFFGERPGLACAYVLFYQETTLEAVKREQEAEGLAAAEAHPHSIHIEPTTPGFPPRPNGLYHVQSAVTAAPVTPIDEYPHSPLDKSVTAPPDSPDTPRIPPLPTTPMKSPEIPKETEMPTASSTPIPKLTPASRSKSNNIFSPSTPRSSTAAAPRPKSDFFPKTAQPSDNDTPTAAAPTEPKPMSKKEKAKEDKARKQVEKEAEKREKEEQKIARKKRQEAETRRHEADIKAASDMRAAIEASKRSKVEEDKMKKTFGGNEAAAFSAGLDGHNVKDFDAATSSSPRDISHHRESSSGLERFRVGSKSVSKKLWGSSSSKDLKHSEAMPSTSKKSMDGKTLASSGTAPAVMPSSSGNGTATNGAATNGHAPSSTGAPAENMRNQVVAEQPQSETQQQRAATEPITSTTASTTAATAITLPPPSILKSANGTPSKNGNVRASAPLPDRRSMVSGGSVGDRDGHGDALAKGEEPKKEKKSRFSALKKKTSAMLS
ncbi:Ubiquitin carboxyl-terminal hydrolase 46, partial [Agyrium rufum]|nr:Ubiquitin carboxyl-terminal hydrolase 46 [Agyrium rufum]